MSFDFIKPVIAINGKCGEGQFTFYKQGFVLNGYYKGTPTYIDILLSGVSPLILANAIADGLNYLKLFGGTELLAETYLDTVTLSGGCEQNGTPTPTVPVNIVCNNGTIKVSKNLLNNPSYIKGLLNDNGILGSTSNTCTLDYYPVEPNTTYTFSFIKQRDVQYDRLCEYSSNNESSFLNLAVKQSNRDTPAIGESVIMTFTTTANTHYIRVSLTCSYTYEDGLPEKAQLETGTTATPYMPYGQIYTDGTVETVTDSNGLTASAEMLLAIGDYKDTQEVIGGTVTRRIGIKVLKGTENWSRDTKYCWNLTSETRTTLDAYCTHFKMEATIPPSSEGGSVRWGKMFASSYGLAIGARAADASEVSSTVFATVDDWNNYLANQYAQGTPVIITFPLATATTSTVTGQFLSKSPVTQTAGSISNLPIAITESQKTVPTPTQPLQINCNNGVVKVSKNLFDKNTMVLDASVNTNYSIVSSTTSDYNKTIVVPVKPNTTYVVNRDLGESVQRFRVAVSASSTKPVVGTGCTAPADLESISGGAIFTTKSDTKWAVIWIASRAAGASIEQVDYAVNTCQLETGTVPTSYQPYVEGGIYTDGTTETVQITGKNLFDYSAVTETGKYINDSGAVKNDPYSAYWSNIPVEPSTTYTCSGIANFSGNIRLHGYTKDGTWDRMIDKISASGSSDTTVTFTTDANEYFISISGYYEQFKNCQIELGSTATTYEPYYNGGQATAQPLYKVGTYQDVQSVLDGGVTRNIGIMVLDGTEGWVSASISDLYYFVSSNIKYDSAYPALCSHYACELPSVTGANMGDKKVKVGYTASGTHDRVYIKDSSFANVSGLTTWLASQYANGTPVIIVYPLLEPTTESVTGQPLSIQQGTNIVTITQASMDDLTLEVSYKAGAIVTITEVENAQLSDNVEVTIQ